MNSEEQHFVSMMRDHFGDIVSCLDSGSVLVEHEMFVLRFSLKEMRFIIHSIRVLQEGHGIGGEIVCFVQEFCEHNLVFEIIAENVLDSAFTFWEEAGFNANGNNYYYDV